MINNNFIINIYKRKYYALNIIYYDNNMKQIPLKKPDIYYKNRWMCPSSYIRYGFEKNNP